MLPLVGCTYCNTLKPANGEIMHVERRQGDVYAAAYGSLSSCSCGGGGMLSSQSPSFEAVILRGVK